MQGKCANQQETRVHPEKNAPHFWSAAEKFRRNLLQILFPQFVFTLTAHQRLILKFPNPAEGLIET
jgi:hypothetical protein